MDTFGVDASASTDADGRFSISARLNSRVEVMVQNDEVIGQFFSSPFPPSNRIDSLVWKLSEKTPLLAECKPAAETAHSDRSERLGRSSRR